MIVVNPISSVKVGNTISRLTIGQRVPKIVLNFWKESGQIDDLIKNGSIKEEKEKKEEKKNDFLRPNKDSQ